MKFGKFFSVWMAFAMLLSLGALARENNQGKLDLYDRAQIGNTVLQPGTYTVKWTGTGPEVQVNVLQNKQTVATAMATLKNESNLTQDAVVLRLASDNSSPKEIAEIDFGSRKEALVITPGTANQNR